MSGDTFTVILPTQIRDRLLQWAKEAAVLNRKSEYLAALKSMNAQLELTPAEWGDPFFNYTTIDAVECRGLIENWFFVWYGLHPASRSVVIREVRAAPGSILQT